MRAFYFTNLYGLYTKRVWDETPQLDGLEQCKGVCMHVFKARNYFSPCESEGVCFTGVGLCVCLSMNTITKKIMDGFVPNFMGRFLGKREDQVRVSLRWVVRCKSNGQKT